MLFRTHLAAALFVFLLFFHYISNPFIFLVVIAIATILPDIDNKSSKIGRNKIFRIFNLFANHRGAIHSLTFLLFFGIILFLFFRIIFFPFVIGYSLHLFLDCLTLNGINLFFPLKFKIKGFIKTGGVLETVLFILLLAGDFFLFLSITL